MPIIGKSPIINIYPNPNEGVFLLEIEAGQNRDFEIQVQNSIGQIIFEDQIKKHSGTYKETINLGNHAKGIYYFQMNIDSQIINEKIIIK